MLLRFLAGRGRPSSSRAARPGPARLRDTSGPLLLRRPPPPHCAACGMLLGAVALRLGACPRCRARFTSVDGTRGR